MNKYRDPVSHYSRRSHNYDPMADICHLDSGFIFRACREAGCSIVSGQKLLDFGCGTCRSSLLFADAGLDVAGVDAASGMLRMAKDKGAAKLLCLADFNKGDLPFSSVSFNWVISDGVFCLFEDIGPLIAEAARILLPRGYLAFSVEDISIRSSHRESCRSGIRIFRHPIEYILPLLKSNGLSFLEVRRFLAYTPPCQFGAGGRIFFSAVICQKN